MVGTMAGGPMNWRRLARKVQSIIWRVTQPLTVGVRALMIRGTRVVLVKHTYQDHWYLPGGMVQKRETSEDAIKRELREEIECSGGRYEVFGVYTSFYEGKSDHIIIFRVTEFELGQVQQSEIAEVDLFELDRLPNDVSPGTRRRIDELRRVSPPVHGVW